MITEKSEMGLAMNDLRVQIDQMQIRMIRIEIILQHLVEAMTKGFAS